MRDTASGEADEASVARWELYRVQFSLVAAGCYCNCYAFAYLIFVSRDRSFPVRLVGGLSSFLSSLSPAPPFSLPMFAAYPSAFLYD